MWFLTEIERPGDVGRSIEKRTDGDDWLECCPDIRTRGGEAPREKKVDDRAAKLELDEAKPEDDEQAIDGEEAWNVEQRWPLDLLLDEDAIVAPVRKELSEEEEEVAA
ncbi:hypothetical protein NL676_006905 [Syzygium grande]|nr:hypothetical protein NL676_006905 [Syzygium grande]